MRARITLKQVVRVVKLSVLPLWFWPLPQNASKSKIVCMKLYHCVSAILAGILATSMIYSLLNNLHDPYLVVQSAFPLFPSIHVILNTFNHEFIYQRLQYVTFEMERFCELIKPNEEAIVQREYINKCAKFYGFAMVAFYASVLFCFLRPFILHEPFPISVDLPSAVYYEPLKTIIYIQQMMAGILISGTLCVSCYMALLLWLTSAKFRLLNENLRKITNIYDFAKLVEDHQRLLEHAKEVALVVRPFAMTSVLGSTVTLIIFGLIFITGAPFAIKLQCIGFAISASSEVFLYVWPAEHLIHACTNVGQTAFNIDWYNKPANLKRNLLTVILRSQKPVVVALPWGMPSLSLKYYATYLSTIFSCFTALRIIFEEEKNMT